LELWLQELLEGFLIHFIGGRDLLTRGFINDKLWLRLLVLHKENSTSLLEAVRVTIQDIATILTIILVQPPSNSFIGHLNGETLAWVLLLELFEIPLDINVCILVVRVSILLIL
jgi:hypothetical protein